VTRPFLKPPTTYAEQVVLLQSRGMEINDPAQAEFYLQQINYYRLCAYWLPFEQAHATHAFRPGTRFEDVLAIYYADRQLRLLFLDAIERIEVSFRCHWAYQMAHKHGPHSHLDSSLARKANFWQANKERLEAEVERSDEVFILHMKNTYSEPLPPVWACSEVMTLGLLSSWYDNLKPSATRAAVSCEYQLDDSVLSSWLHHLTVVRNVCAHHCRLWNRNFVVTPQLPRTKPSGLGAEFIPGSRKIYNTLVLTQYLMSVIAPKSQWKKRLLDQLQTGVLAPSAMGFPNDWQTRSIWGGGTIA
jgi:abortive infection bacteriophage resistance protein